MNWEYLLNPLRFQVRHVRFFFEMEGLGPVTKPLQMKIKLHMSRIKDTSPMQGKTVSLKAGKSTLFT